MLLFDSFFFSSSSLTHMLNKVLLSQILLFSLFLTNRQLSEKTGHVCVQYFLLELYVIDLQLVSLLPISAPSGLNAEVMVLKYKSNKVNFLIKPLMALWWLHDKKKALQSPSQSESSYFSSHVSHYLPSWTSHFMILKYAVDPQREECFYAFCSPLLLILQYLVQIFISCGESFLTHQGQSGCTPLSIFRQLFPLCLSVCSHVSFSPTHTTAEQARSLCIHLAWTMTTTGKDFQ